MKLAWLLLAALAPTGARAATDGLEPAALRQLPPPRYPDSLIRTRCLGATIARFEVDDTGHVRAIVVEHATHPDFVPPTVASLRHALFDPAKKRGAPIASSHRRAFEFDPGSDLEWRGLSRIPPSLGNFLYGFVARGEKPDAPAQPRAVVNAVYPYGCALAGATGHAEIEFTVGADGRVVETTVVHASAPEFGAALQAMAEACVFFPAKKDGRAAPARFRREQRFSHSAAYSPSDRDTRALVEQLKSGAALAGLSDLDAPPRACYQPGAAFPPALQRAGVAGEAEIEFIIDAKGRAQLPRIVGASRPEFGWAAATAVQQWFFEPPRRAGRPTPVRLRVPVEFRLAAAR